MAAALALKAAVLVALALVYAAPELALEQQRLVCEALRGEASAAAPATARQLRTALTLAATLASLGGCESPRLVAAACAHAAMHALTVASDAPTLLGAASAPAMEAALLASFVALLGFVVFPPASTLAAFSRHRKNLARFFSRHDKKYLPYVDHLLEDHVGHERLLYARIRRLYRSRAIETAAELSSAQ